MRRGPLLLLVAVLLPAMVLIALDGGCGGRHGSGAAAGDDAGGDDAADDDGDDQDTTPPGAPYVEQPTSPTYLNAARVQGIAEAGATVRVRGGSAEATQASDPTSGAFCLLALLNPGAVNELRVSAIDGAGNEGPATTVDVEQVAPSADFDLTQDRPATASTTLGDQNGPEKAVDGDTATYWESDGPLLQPSTEWLKVDLQDFRQIDGFEIHWNGATTFGYDYDLRMRTDELPPADPSGAAWLVVWYTHEGKPGVVTITLAAPIYARWVAIVMHRDGGQFPFNDYQLAEFTVTGHESTVAQGCE